MSNSKALRVAKKTAAAVLSLAVAVAPVAIPGTAAAKGGKVKKVKVTAPVTNGGTLVLKKGQQVQIKVQVTTSGKASKKVTYKSSNSKVAKVVMKKGKAYVKAVGKKGKTAKITIAAQANKKKKATLKVKVGTPTKKLSFTSVKETSSVVRTSERARQKKDELEKRKSDSLPADVLQKINKNTEKKTNKNIKVKKNKVTIYTGYTDKKNPDDEKSYTYTYKLNVKPSPSGASKSYKFKSNKTSVLRVTPDGTLVIRKAKDLKKKTDYALGTATITAFAKDGTNKKATVKVTVMAKANIKPVMVYEEDSRTATMVEDFESYKEGTKWERFTAGGYANSGTMTVVKDPENDKNKVLKITYDGKDQAYDFAPIFNLKLPAGKKLGDYSAIRMKSRIISNSSDCNYKSAYVYFDGKGTMKSTDYFATSNFDGSDPKTVPDVKNRFGVNISMAAGVDKNYNVPDTQTPGLAIQDKSIIELCADRQYNNKNLPTFYSSYSEGDKEAISPGFSEEETTAASEKKAGFQQNTLEFKNERIEGANIQGDDKTPLLDRNELDMVIGSTYEGVQNRTYDDYHVTLYLDDIQVLSGLIALEKVEFVDVPKKLACGDEEAGTVGSSAKLQVMYTPKNTTQKDLVWKSSDENLAKVEADGTVTANNKGKEGPVTITATSKDNPKLAATCTIQIYSVLPAKEDYDVLAAPTLKILPKGEITAAGQMPVSNIDTFTVENGVLKGTYNSRNVSIVLDLGEEMDLNRYKGAEISGICPGSLALEFYSESLDMYQTKDNNYDKDWWETTVGKTYPFYVGSCAWRYENGGMNYLRATKEGFCTDPTNIRSAKPSDEHIRYSWANLTDDGCSGDWSRVRYIIVKSNQNPGLPQKALNGKEEMEYQVTGLKFLAEEVVDAKTEGHYLMYNSEQEATKANIASTEGNVTSYYVDKISDEKPADKRDRTMNFSDFRYIKVKVKDTDSVKVGLVADGKTVADAVIIGEETGTGERSVYVSLDDVDKEVLKNLDQITVETAAGGTVSWLSATKGLINYSKAGNVTETKFEVTGKTVRPVTLDDDGDEA